MDGTEGFIPLNATSGARSGQRRFHFADVQTVRLLLFHHPEWGRLKLSLYLCQLWNWKLHDGIWNHRACRHWLQRLHDKNLITLPPPSRSPGSTSKKLLSLPVAQQRSWNQQPPSHFSLNHVVVRPVTRGELPRWRFLMSQYHYLGFKSLVGESIAYVATVDAEWVALLGWGAAAWKSCHREAWIGWDEARKLQRLHLVANNVRFLILPGVKVKNLASKVLGLNLKRLSLDWQNKYAHPIVLVETFVDPARFQGICYKAAGFLPLGRTQGYTKCRQGYVPHGQPKMIWIRPLDPRARQWLCADFPVFAVNVSTKKEDRMILDMNKLPLAGEGGLAELLSQIPDPRKPRGVRHPLGAILGMATCAVLAGMKSFEAIAQWAAMLPREARETLGSTRETPPSESTFRRTLQKLDPARLDGEVGAWFADHNVLVDKLIAVDGKTVRGSHDDKTKAIHLLGALLAPEGIVVAQRQVSEKTNEIPEIKPLLAPLNLQGCIVSADAMHTQKATAQYLVEEKKADYLFTVKDNQPTLRKDIEDLDWGSFSPCGD